MALPRVLVIDDYDDARELLVIVFADAGFTVTSTGNGEEALTLARQHRPDVIVIDILMPGMDGIEVTRCMKEDPQLANIPIVAYTANPSLVVRHRRLFDALCKKPCDPDKLVTVVREALRSG
jgi:CheY-like chemotaxis protein